MGPVDHIEPAVPAGTYWPAVSDGYDVLLPPLPRGRHTLRFGGTGYAGGDFSQEISYEFTIK